MCGHRSPRGPTLESWLSAPAAHVRPVVGGAFQWSFGKWNVTDTERGLEVMLMRDD